MNTRALGTLDRAAKGPLAPPPTLREPSQTVVDAVAAWPGVVTTVHWHFADPSRIDGVDFYVDEQELGHIHLDGEMHVATNVELGKALVAEGAARPFRYLPGWVEENVARIGTTASIALFRRNYEQLLR